MRAIEVHGLRETLAELRKVDKTIYKAIADEFKKGAKPVVREVAKAYPKKPLKYWKDEGQRRGRARMPDYSQPKARKGVRAVVQAGGRKHGILRIEQRDAGGQVYDIAGSRNMSQFVKNLDKASPTKSKPPKLRSRLLYTTVADNMDLIEDEINAIIGRTEKYIQAKIVSF